MKNHSKKTKELSSPSRSTHTRVQQLQRRSMKDKEKMAGGSDSVQDVLASPSCALDPNTRSIMESRFGHSFSKVRVHTDADASRSAQEVDARAYTVGNHITFYTGEYKPRTLDGDALIAHELAHVMQQNSGDSRFTAESVSDLEDSRLEEDANASIPYIVASILGGTKTVFNRITQNAMPSLKTGLRLQRCKRDESIQAPSFLGKESRETLDQINRIMENGGALKQWIAFGQIITSFENPISALHTAEAAEAIAAVPVIVRYSVTQQIQLLLITHGNELSREERSFWENMLTKFSQ